MDPYLEGTDVWPGFHHGMAEEVVQQLNTVIGPKYYADVSLRTVGETIIVGSLPVSYPPDVGVYERKGASAGERRTAVVLPPAPLRRPAPLSGQARLRAVHVYLTGTDRLVTTMEILSPYNKRPREGLEEYRAKRSRLLSSSTHLIEIDLLRGGERTGPELEEPPLDCEYLLLVNRFNVDAPRVSEIWPVSLNEPLPRLPLPLLPGDDDAIVDLNAAIHAVYASRGYGWRIDYRQPVPPPMLRPAIAAWMAEHLREEGRL
jgi:hypothetical protein